MSYADVGLEPAWLDQPDTASERRNAEHARHLHRAR